MKLLRTSSVILFAVLLLAFPGRLSATRHIVSVGNFFFSPATLSVSVGDTIRWVWSAGTHTTTSVSGGIPAGAAAWDALITSSITSFEYKVTVPGSYAYVCTPHAPGMAGSFNATPVGISAPSLSGVRIGPNPTTGLARISCPEAAGTSIGITVYNVSGTAVKTESVTAGKENLLDLRMLPEGLYLVRLTSGSASETRQLIVAR